jgi:hypothetical protein
MKQRAELRTFDRFSKFKSGVASDDDDDDDDNEHSGSKRMKM